MRENKLGTFYGQEIVIKSDENKDWVKLWENWRESEKRMAVEHYKHELFLEELKNAKYKSFWYYYKQTWKGYFNYILGKGKN